MIEVLLTCVIADGTAATTAGVIAGVMASAIVDMNNGLNTGAISSIIMEVSAEMGLKPFSGCNVDTSMLAVVSTSEMEVSVGRNVCVQTSVFLLLRLLMTV